VVETDFEHAVRDAVELARSHDADYLSGWCGPVDDLTRG
jgi:hypothetical protein